MNEPISRSLEAFQRAAADSGSQDAFQRSKLAGGASAAQDDPSKHEFKICTRCFRAGKWTALEHIQHTECDGEILVDVFRCPVCSFTEPFKELQSTQAHQPAPTPTPSILTEAEVIINGPRQAAYGDPATNFARIATGWSAIIGASVTPRQVPLMMIWLKVCREANRPQRDNLVDIAGYAALAEKLLNVNPPTPQPL